MLKPALVLVALLLTCVSALAAPKPVDFTKITLNHVTLGQTSGEAEHYLGVQHKNSGRTIEFNDRSPLGRHTVDVVKNRVVYVRNMSELQISGRTVLRANDPASSVATVFAPSIPHTVSKSGGMTSTMYTQNGRVVTVVVENGKIAGFALGPAK
jgi:hypothetical protein